MASRAYVETSVPSFYFEARTSPDMVARRDWTRSWWAAAVRGSELVTSVAVVEELQRGEFASRGDCIELVRNLPLVSVEPAVLEIVEA